MSEASAQAFDSAEFQQALAVLESEQQAMQLSARQRLSLRLYSYCMGGLLVFLIALIAYASAKLFKTQVSDVEYAVVGFLAIGGGICLVCAVVALVLNLKLVVKIIRSRIHFRRMVFSDESEALWKAHQKTRRGSAVIEKIALGLSILFLLLTLPFAFAGVWWALTMICIAAVFLMFYVLQSGKARMDMMSHRLAELTELKESMAHLANRASQAEGGRVALPSDVIQQYSRVETEQIARSRAQAITDSLRATQREFSILSSQQVRQAKTALAPGDRLKVEAALDRLMADPRPRAAEQDSGSGLFRLPVNGTGLELIYGLDESRLQLRLLTLQSSAVGSVSSA